VGPIGRSLASEVSAGNKGAAHAFSYAHSKGLFFGASLEASGIAARPDVNRKFYGQKLSPSVLLSGEYARPRGKSTSILPLILVIFIRARNY
jgi:lipid-binding SYLF domain-containing protein